MRRKLLLFLLLFFASRFLFAQVTKTTTNVQQLWLSHSNQTRLSNKFGLWGDFHLRTKEDFTKDLSTTIARIGIMYYVNDATKLTAGYGFVTNYPVDGTVRVNQPEHRPWQQVQWNTKYAKTRMMQWIRLEERYRKRIANDTTLANSYNFNFRLRYNLWYEIPFSTKTGLASKFSFVVNDELHINFGKQIVNNYFDQNRLFLGFKYNTNAHDNIQVGYMNQFVQQAAGNKYRNNDAIRISYFQNLDLRKKNKV